MRNIFSRMRLSAEYCIHWNDMLKTERLLKEFVIGSPKPKEAESSLGPSLPLTVIYGVAYPTPALTCTRER